jgi:hypothetical protein
MYLIKLASIDETINIVANLHNSIILGRKMMISFTHSKIN